MKNAIYAQQIIDLLERETKSLNARLALARLALSRHGNYDESGKNVFRAYLHDHENVT